MELKHSNHGDDIIKIENLKKRARFLILYRGKKETEELLKKIYLDKVETMEYYELLKLVKFLEKDDIEILKELLK